MTAKGHFTFTLGMFILLCFAFLVKQIFNKIKLILQSSQDCLASWRGFALQEYAGQSRRFLITFIMIDRTVMGWALLHKHSSFKRGHPWESSRRGKLSLFESCVQKHHVATLNTSSLHLWLMIHISKRHWFDQALGRSRKKLLFWSTKKIAILPLYFTVFCSS